MLRANSRHFGFFVWRGWRRPVAVRGPWGGTSRERGSLRGSCCISGVYPRDCPAIRGGWKRPGRLHVSTSSRMANPSGFGVDDWPRISTSQKGHLLGDRAGCQACLEEGGPAAKKRNERPGAALRISQQKPGVLGAYRTATVPYFTPLYGVLRTLRTYVSYALHTRHIAAAKLEACRF